MKTTTRTRWALALAGSLTVGLAAFALVLGGHAAAHAADGHPARLQKGTCKQLGAVAFRLTGVGASLNLDETPIATPQAVGPDAALGVDTSVTTVNAKLDDIVAGGHAINVFASDTAMDKPIACGDVGGPRLGEDLAVALQPVNGSGRQGIAVLHASGNQTVVSIYLAENPNGEEGGGTPAASPTS